MLHRVLVNASLEAVVGGVAVATADTTRNKALVHLVDAFAICGVADLDELLGLLLAVGASKNVLVHFGGVMDDGESGCGEGVGRHCVVVVVVVVSSGGEIPVSTYVHILGQWKVLDIHDRIA